MFFALACPASAEPAKWGAHLDFEGHWGNSRALGDAGLFAPLWQNNTSLLFTDIRGKFDSQDGREGNFGLGYRRMETAPRSARWPSPTASTATTSAYGGGRA